MKVKVKPMKRFRIEAKCTYDGGREPFKIVHEGTSDNMGEFLDGLEDGPLGGDLDDVVKVELTVTRL